VIGRALADWESRSAPGKQEYPQTPFAALNTARNYRNLAEYAEALAWYTQASAWDSAGHFAAEIGWEALASAVALTDSLKIVAHLVNTLGASDLKGRDRELILLFRYLIATHDLTNLRLLEKKVAGQQDRLSCRLRTWYAFSLVNSRAWSLGLAQLRRVILAGTLDQGLTDQEMAWVLTAIPDLLCLTNQEEAAAILYQILAQCTVPYLQLWGLFQLAHLDFLAGQYQRAQSNFDRVCDHQNAARWQQAACDMARLANTMRQIKAEGEPYGASAFYER
jgi:hypothetical protein